MKLQSIYRLDYPRVLSLLREFMSTIDHYLINYKIIGHIYCDRNV
jgi:hypothetical protein